MSALPTDAEIRNLHRLLAPTPEAYDLVLTHCEIVWQIASQLLPDDVDADLVRVGCLLHDVGVHRLRPGENYIRHGLLGHQALAELGLPAELCRFCSCHTGVGLTADDIEKQDLPLPPGDYEACTAEELLVMYADKFHSKKTPPVFLTARTYAAGLARFGSAKEARFAELAARYGEPDLTALSAAHGHRII